MTELKAECSFPAERKDDILSMPGDALFFDIETTGLSRRTSHLYLIGCSSAERSGEGGCRWVLRQWLLDHPSREKELLEAFSGFLREHAGPLIHFNGASFDIPYLQAKYRHYGMPDPFSSPDHPDFDLYRALRPFRSALGLDSLRLRDMETACGIVREDRFTGGELIEHYRTWLGTRSTELKNDLLTHNRDDILGLMMLYPLRAYSDLFSGNFEIVSISWQENHLTFSLRTELSAPLPLEMSDAAVSLRYHGREGLLSVRAEYGTKKLFLPDPQNYYYLPDEDYAVHKSIGSFVDPAHRKRASAKTCYQKKEGFFLPQEPARISPAFYNDFRSRPAWFSIPSPPGMPFDDPSGGAAGQYAADLIRMLFRSSGNGSV